MSQLGQDGWPQLFRGTLDATLLPTFNRWRSTTGVPKRTWGGPELVIKLTIIPNFDIKLKVNFRALASDPAFSRKCRKWYSFSLLGDRK